jgi:DNA-binding CsgD family transcriptional regulator/tetratricopeptide (TPR) repeat protein
VILSPNALMARLSSRLTLLSGNRRDAPPRHQTMRAAIAWSYELLTEPEQRLFRLLSVFSGGFTVAAVEGVCRRWAADVPVLDTLAALVDHSLVKHGARVGDSVRFELLETMRAFGLDHLAAHSEEDAARDAHAACFAEMAADTEAEVLGQSRIASLDQVEVEYDNIWAALGWLIQHERIEAAMDLAGSLWLLRRVPVYTAEARGQLDVLLVDPRARGRTSRRARALLLLGTYASELGDPAAARDALEEAQSIFEELGDALGMSRVLRRMAVTLSNTGSIEPAIAALRQRLDLTPRDGHEWEIASTLDYLGGLLLYQNDHVATQECLTEALRLYRAIDDRFGIASVLSTQGMLSAREGDAERARRCYRECIELSAEFDYDYHLTIAQLGLADVDLRGGEVEAAAAGLIDALAASQQTGWLHGAGVARAGLGVVEMRRGNLGLAIEQERGSLADFRRLGLRFGLQHGAALSFDALACIALIAGDGEAAARFLGMADGLHERIGVARPTGEPDFVGRTEIDRIRAGLASPRLHDVWEAGRIAAEGEIVAAAMEYQLPAGVAGAGVAVPEAARSLTARELEVLRLIAAGKSNQQIAETLFVSTRTAAGHVGNLLQKLGLKSRTGVVAFAVRNGLA